MKQCNLTVLVFIINIFIFLNSDINISSSNITINNTNATNITTKQNSTSANETLNSINDQLNVAKYWECETTIRKIVNISVFIGVFISILGFIIFICIWRKRKNTESNNRLNICTKILKKENTTTKKQELFDIHPLRCSICSIPVSCEIKEKLDVSKDKKKDYEVFNTNKNKTLENCVNIHCKNIIRSFCGGFICFNCYETFSNELIIGEYTKVCYFCKCLLIGFNREEVSIKEGEEMCVVCRNFCPDAIKIKFKQLKFIQNKIN